MAVHMTPPNHLAVSPSYASISVTSFQLTRPADRDRADLVLPTARARSGLRDYTMEEGLNADC
jgi:hypothetical protein